MSEYCAEEQLHLAPNPLMLSGPTTARKRPSSALFLGRLVQQKAPLSRDERLHDKLGEAAFERVKVFGVERVGPIWDQSLFPDDGQALRRGEAES